ncbi:hypothetical protein FQA39_LY10918 [Lamprigera yunnana]|nr:hypothetical protein FQA39_LY10918 [Lamprigera yunnana]
MSSMTIKVREGVKKFLDKAKSRSVPLHLGSIMKSDANSCEDNVVADQSIDLPWSIPKDYNMNNETRLLAHGNALEETLINSTRYDLDNDEKYIEMGYSTHLELQPKVLGQWSENELCIQNMGKTEDITEHIQILYHWEYSEGLSSPMMPAIAMTASNPMRNGGNMRKNSKQAGGPLRSPRRTGSKFDDVKEILSLHYDASQYEFLSRYNMIRKSFSTRSR